MAEVGLRALEAFEREVAHLQGHFMKCPWYFMKVGEGDPSLISPKANATQGTAEPDEGVKPVVWLLDQMSTGGHQCIFWPQVQLQV